MNQQRAPLLSRDTIAKALELLGARLAAKGIEARIYVVGGAAMALAFARDRVTRDIDAVFEPKMQVYQVARELAPELGLPEDWLNDAAKGFVPGTDPAALPVFTAPGVEVTAASAETLLAMKVLAGRVEQDTDDIVALAQILGLTTSEEVLDVALARYPADLLPARSRFLVESVFGPARARPPKGPGGRSIRSVS